MTLHLSLIIGTNLIFCVDTFFFFDLNTWKYSLHLFYKFFFIIFSFIRKLKSCKINEWNALLRVFETLLIRSGGLSLLYRDRCGRKRRLFYWGACDWWGTRGDPALPLTLLSPSYFASCLSPICSMFRLVALYPASFHLTSPHLTSLYHISPGVTAVRPIFLRHKSHLVSLRPTLSSLSFSFSLFLFSIQTRQRDVVTRRFAASHMNLTQIENATYIQNNLFFFFLHLYNLSYRYIWFNNLAQFFL